MLRKLLTELSGVKQEFQNMNSQSPLYRHAFKIASSTMSRCACPQFSTTETTWLEVASKNELGFSGK